MRDKYLIILNKILRLTLDQRQVLYKFYDKHYMSDRYFMNSTISNT